MCLFQSHWYVSTTIVAEIQLTSNQPMFSFTGNKKSVAGGGANTFYGKPGLSFYTQTKTVTSLWRSEDATHQKSSVNMPRVGQ
jgi:acyl-CoA reductase-like NAD-dependent aldehyde dehydrogenase